jgi:hypothetical protein
MKDEGVVGVRDPREGEFPLFRVIEGVRASEGVLVARVEQRRAQLGEQTGLSGRALADALAQQLVEEASVRSALIGATSALPLSLPLLGPWASLVLAVSAGAFFQLAGEVELVYQLAAVYRTRLSPARLRMVAFWLVRLTNYEDLRQKALALGVRVTVRKLVEKLVAVGLARAVGATAQGVMTSAVVRGTAAAPLPWYVRATAYLGVPVIAALGWQGTRAVGQRALAYFSEELAVR